MADRHEARIKFSATGSLQEIGAKLEELIRGMTDHGLTVEAYDIDNVESEDITPREQPPTDKP